jgi:uncharacterized protein YndB with AHSA1/START domain
MQGTLETAGDRWRLRFSRRLAHPPEKVWRAIMEAEHRDAWFPQRIVGDFSVGARLRFVSDAGDFEGKVLAYQPQRLVEFVWGTDVIRLEVSPDSGGTLLTLLDTFGEQGKAARDAAGWHVCLDALESALDGRPRGISRSRWLELHPGYVAEFGAEASSIRPPTTSPA